MKLGIIGYGFIVGEFLPGLTTLPGIELTAILGKPGREETVSALCEKYGIPNSVYSFPDLLATGIDTVYVAIPNHLHYEYAKMALEAGLNVILEKPFTSNLAQAKELQALAMEKQKFLFEAITTLHLPGYAKIKEWLPRIGRVRMVQGHFVKFSIRYENFCNGKVHPVFDANKSGGSLMDLNVYNIHFMLGLFGMPESIQYTANLEQGVDTNGILLLNYPDFTALCTAGKDCAELRKCAILGTEGGIYVEEASSTLGNLTLELRDGTRETFPDYDKNLRHLREFSTFRDAIQEGNLAFCYERLKHSMQVMEVLDKARESAGIRFPADN